MRLRNLIRVMAASAVASQLAATAPFDRAAMAVEAVTAHSAVMVYSSRGRCNGAVLAQDLVLTAAHCVVGKADFKIVGSIGDTLYTIAEVAAAEPHPQYITATAPAPLTVPDMALLRLRKPLPTAFGPALVATRNVALGDRVEVVGRGAPPTGSSRAWSESAGMAVFKVDVVNNYMLAFDDRPGYGQISRLGGCYGFSGAPVFAIRTGVPLLAGIMRRGDCGHSFVATPIVPLRPWLAETANRLGSEFAR